MKCPNCQSIEVSGLRQKKETAIDNNLNLMKCHECNCVYVEFNFKRGINCDW